MTSLTGIPIEVLFACMGALMLGVSYLVMRELDGLRKGQAASQVDSAKRGRQLTAIQTVLVILAQKAGIPYNPED